MSRRTQEENVKLLVGDNDKVYVLPKQLLKQSKTITDQISDLGTDVEVPVPNISSNIFDAVVDFMQHHQADTKEEIEESIKIGTDFVMPPWDAKFLKDRSVDELSEIILASNYLDIPQLLHAAVREIATRLKGKTTEQMRVVTGVKDDFTPAERAEIEKETAWCDEKEEKPEASSKSGRKTAKSAAVEEEEEDESD